MITRIVKLHFQKGQRDLFLKIFHETKMKVATFEGCRGMRLLNDLKNPDVFFTYSRWDNESCLENYRKSALFKTIWSSIKPSFEEAAEAWSTEVYFDYLDEI